MNFGKIPLILAAILPLALVSIANSQEFDQIDPRDKIYKSRGLDNEDTQEPYWSAMATCYGATMSIAYIMEKGSIEKTADKYTLWDIEDFGDKWREFGIARLMKDRQMPHDAAFEIIGIAAHEASKQLSEAAGENYDKMTADILTISTIGECQSIQNDYSIRFGE